MTNNKVLLKSKQKTKNEKRKEEKKRKRPWTTPLYKHEHRHRHPHRQREGNNNNEKHNQSQFKKMSQGLQQILPSTFPCGYYFVMLKKGEKCLEALSNNNVWVGVSQGPFSIWFIEYISGNSCVSLRS